MTINEISGDDIPELDMPNGHATVKIRYHSLYSILNFDWLIHLQITACKYRSAANNWCKYFIEHAHFENALSASIKNIFLSKCQHGSFCRVSESELPAVLEEKDAEYTKKVTKVTLNIFRGCLQNKALREAELLTSKVQLCQIKLCFF